MAFRLKQARKMKGLSLRKAAEGLSASGFKLSHEGLNKYEKGLIEIDSTILVKFAKFYGVTNDYLVQKENKKVEFGKIRWFKSSKY